MLISHAVVDEDDAKDGGLEEAHRVDRHDESPKVRSGSIMTTMHSLATSLDEKSTRYIEKHTCKWK